MSLTVQPSHAAPPQQVHGNSMHPKVRRVLERGLAHEWTTKEVEELLKLSPRSCQYLFECGLLAVTRYPAKNENGTKRTCTGLSLLIYLLKYSDEITEADALPAMKKLLPMLTDTMLEGVIGAAREIIRKRQTVLVVVKQAESGERMAESRKPEAGGKPKNVIGFEPHGEFSFVEELTPAAGA